MTYLIRTGIAGVIALPMVMTFGVAVPCFLSSMVRRMPRFCSTSCHADVMTANRDKRVWAVANGSVLKVDDGNVPAPIPVTLVVSPGSMPKSISCGQLMPEN